jgi:hypothetical protein
MAAEYSDRALTLRDGRLSSYAQGQAPTSVQARGDRLAALEADSLTLAADGE